jgi:hypothetical protein
VLRGEGVAEQRQEQRERVGVEMTEVAQADRAVVDEPGAGRGGLLGLGGRVLGEVLPRLATIDHAVRLPTPFVAASAPQPWADHQRRRLRPRRRRRDRVLRARLLRVGIEREMARAVQAERRLPELVHCGVVGRLREPHGQLTEVGGAIRAAGAALIQHRDHGEQIGDRLACADPQELRLARETGRGDEPLPKAEPAFPPRGQLGGERPGAEVLGRQHLADLGRGVLGVTTGDQLEHPIDAGGIEALEQLGDLAAGPREVLDESLEVLDQPVLVGAERVGVELVEIDRPLQRPHERLRVLGEVGAPAHEVAQQLCRPPDVRFGLERELAECAQSDRDVLERDPLEGSAPAELLVEHRERSLRGLARVGELVQEPRAVKVLDTCHPARVWVGAQVAPLLELRERVGDRLRFGRAVLGQCLDDVLAAQVHNKPPLGGEEREHHLSVEQRVRRGQISERLEPLRARLVCRERHRLAYADSRAGRNVAGLSPIRPVPS